MLRRNIKERREHIYRKSLKGKQRLLCERNRTINEALEEGKPIPTEHRNEGSNLRKEVDFEDENTAGSIHNSKSKLKHCIWKKKARRIIQQRMKVKKFLEDREEDQDHNQVSKKGNDAASMEIFNMGCAHIKNEKQTICVQGDGSTDKCVLDTIFSPTFHITKDVHGNICENGNNPVNEEQATKSGFDCHVPMKQQKSSLEISTAHSTCLHEDHGPLDEERDHKEYPNQGNLSLGIFHGASATLIATHSSRLECVDEPCHDIMSKDDCVEAVEEDDSDDFDPYFFIRNLPDLSAIVPSFRPMLLPKQTRSCPSTTLVLDLDETLVHSSLDFCENVDFTFPVNFNQKEHTVYVRCRPCLKDFLERVSTLFEIVIFTASQSVYGEQLLNVLDPKRRIFRHRVYREACVFVDGNYLKDLSVLGRDLARVIIIDNSPQAFGFQVDNGIPIASWFDDLSDRALLSLLPFLESLVSVEDVRPLIAKEFNLRGKIAAATCPSMIF